MFKRIISILIAFVMLFSCVAFGAEEEKSELEALIPLVKARIDVPDEYSEFSSSMESSEAEKLWRLNWTVADGNSGIWVTAGEGGFIIGYGRYGGDTDKMWRDSLAEVSLAQAQASADAFLKRTVDYYKELKLVDSELGGGFTFYYKLYKNNLPVNFAEAAVTVNSYDGEVKEFYGISKTDYLISYPSPNGIISSEKAKNAYIDDAGVELKYFIYRDYGSKTVKSFPGYTLSDPKKAVNAVSGEILKLDDDVSLLKNSGATAEAAADYDYSSGLTKEEQNELENISGVMSSEQALSLVKKYGLIKSSDELINSSLQKDYFDDSLSWYIAAGNKTMSIDAVSGYLLNYHSYSDDEEYSDEIEVDENKAYTEMLAVAEKFAPPYAKSYKKENNVETNIHSYRNSVMTASFPREENGLEVEGNGITIRLNMDYELVDYRLEWDRKLSFSKLQNMLSLSEAFDSFDKFLDFHFGYSYVDESPTIVYSPDQSYGFIVIDPYKGERLKDNGSVYVQEEKSNYSDISGHWCEETVNRLQENGFYKPGSEFKPDEAITQIEFLKYYYSREAKTYDNDDDFYAYVVDRGVISDSQIAPQSNVTRYDCAEMSCRILGYGDLLSSNEIFNLMFNDVDENHAACTALVSSAEVMSGNKSGDFNGEDYLSNAEAASVIYNLLK